MAQGIGLNDQNRLPWLTTLHNLLLDWHKSNKSGVLACSSLKQKYRNLLNSGFAYSLCESENNSSNKLMKPFNVNLRILFILLNCDRETLTDRLSKRTHEIIKGTGILDSQLVTLEKPSVNDCLWSDKTEENYLCIEKSFENNTFYYFYVLKCTHEETIKEQVKNILDFLSTFTKFLSS